MGLSLGPRRPGGRAASLPGARWGRRGLGRVLVWAALLGGLGGGAGPAWAGVERAQAAMEAALTRPSDAAGVLDLKTGRLVVLVHPQAFFQRPVIVGSVMKLFTAYAILEAGLGQRRYRCTGTHVDAYGGRRQCWDRRGHGELRLIGALAQSCNNWFAEVAGQLKPRALLSVFARFGFGANPRRGAPDVLPSQLNPRDLPDVAIGDHVSMRVTPASLLSAVSVIASRGQRYPLDCPPGSAGLPAACGPPTPTPLRAELLEQLVEGMRAAAEVGTLASLFQGRGVAAKTGTAKRRYRPGTRGVVVGFAPVVQPRYVFVVIKDRARGATGAGPIALSLLRSLAKPPPPAPAAK